MDVISYETIRAAHRLEKNEQLHELPEGFFQSVKLWLDNKKNKKDTMSLLEIENAKKLLEDIVNRRQRKIVLAALRTIRGEMPPSKMTDSEQKFFDSVVMLLKGYNNDLKEQMFGYSNIIEDKIEEAKNIVEELKESIVIETTAAELEPEVKIEIPKEIESNGKISLKIIKEVPKFIGTDMEHYGPFKEGESASFTNDVADILVSRGLAEKLG